MVGRRRETTVAGNFDNTIRDNASGPKKATGDSGSIEQHALQDQIAADRYLASKKASRTRGLGIRIARLVHSGSA